MNYQKRSYTYHKPKNSRLIFSMYLGILVAASVCTSSVIVAAYDTPPDEVITSELREVEIEKKDTFELNFNSSTEIISYSISNDEEKTSSSVSQDEIIVLDFNESEEDDDDLEDEDPLSQDRYDVMYNNPLDYQFELSKEEIIERYSKYFDHPGTTFYLRGKREISPDDYQYIENIVLGEVGYCSFEQMVAEASLCINLSKQEGVDMYTLVMRPGVFDERYAVKTRQSTEKACMAIEAAIMGVDFSRGATAACTYEWMDKYYQEWFDTLKLTTKIEDSSFYCNPEDEFEFEEYYYSENLNELIRVN